MQYTYNLQLNDGELAFIRMMLRHWIEDMNNKKIPYGLFATELNNKVLSLVPIVD